MVQDRLEGESISELSRIYNVSRKTIYKWLERYEQFGAAGLVERSRRPLHTGRRASAEGKAPKA
jgi:transposase